MFRPRFLGFAATVVASGLIGACSRPADESAHTAPTRDVRLVEPAAPEQVKVSDLEAGRTLTAGRAAGQRAGRTPVARPAKAPEAVVEVAQTPEPTPAPVEAVAEQVEAPAPAPAPAEEVVSIVDRGAQPMYSTGLGTAELAGLGGSRGRGVIIRGGRGGIDDDCDLDRPGHHPVAINRVASPVGGVTLSGRPRTISIRGGFR